MSEINSDHLRGPAPTRRLSPAAPFVAVLRAEVTQQEPEFWRLGGEAGARLDIGGSELVAVVDDGHHCLLVLVTAGRLDLDAERCLSESEGFLVQSASGEPIGVVEEVRVDARSGKVEFEVGAGWLGRHRFSAQAEDVVAILPGTERLILDRPAESRGGPRRRP
jgi:hypothetical protein